jgi:uncharacterized protein
MITAREPIAASLPTAMADRFVVMDVLRGFALFGVMLVNLYQLGGEEVLATSAQLAALPSAGLDAVLQFGVALLVYDKANTLFAFLFGFGFWVQMERLQARGAAFASIYLRRTGILLIVGLVHLLGLFAWDILHVYAVAGLVLLVCRGLPERVLLGLGLALMLFGKPIVSWLADASGISGPNLEIAYSDTAVLARQDAALSGDFGAWVAAMNQFLYLEWLLAGGVVGWIIYVLGRFFMGAWVARQGWIQNAGQHQGLFRRWLWPLLITGLVFETINLLTEDVPEEALLGLVPVARTVLHAVATPLIAAGYVCAIVLLFHGKTLRWLVQPFASVGQMALTNYLLQSVAIVLVLTAAGPGLGLAGKAGISTFLAITIVVYALQILFSSIWMRHFAFGPAEWLWRALTYGIVPPMLRKRASPRTVQERD